MSISNAQYLAWLADRTALRVVLIEATVRPFGAGADVVRYFSTGAYVTGASNTGTAPAHQFYLPKAVANISVTETLNIDGDASMSVGDVELYNTDGELDSWLKDVWVNRPIQAFIGDARWDRADFRMIFNGVIADVASKSRDRINLRLCDKLQRLNNAVSEVKLGGTTINRDAVVPVLQGEAFNITPLLCDVDTYQYNLVSSAGLAEVRDNGIPIANDIIGWTALKTNTPATGKFSLPGPPVGIITCDALGDNTNGYANTVSKIVQRLVTNFGKSVDRFNTTQALGVGSFDYPAVQLSSFSRASTATYIDANKSIQTAAIGVPRIDYTSGSPLLLLEAAATNYCKYSNTLTNAANWALSNCTVEASNASAPVSPFGGGKMFKQKVDGTPAATHQLKQSSISVASQIGNVITASVYAAAGEYTQMYWQLSSTGAAFSSSRGAIFDLVTGVISGVHATVTAGMVSMGNGIWRCWIMSTADGAGTTSVASYPSAVNGTSTGRATLATCVAGDGFYLDCVQVEKGPLSAYIPVPAATAVSRAADAASIYLDLDMVNLTNFDAANQQPVGLYLNDRANVINAAQDLASSLGARVIMSRLGQLQLLRVDLSNLVSTFDIKPHHMVDRDLHIADRTTVIASSKLYFCRNYTPQEGLNSSLTATDKELFALDWLSETYVDAATQALYKLSADPPEAKTQFLRRVDANTEAVRRVNLKKVSRTTYMFEGYSEMFQLVLGQHVTLYHPRFGLAAGGIGMVVSLTPNWSTGHVSVGVMIA